MGDVAFNNSKVEIFFWTVKTLGILLPEKTKRGEI